MKPKAPIVLAAGPSAGELARPAIEKAAKAAMGYASRSISENTRRGYQSDWNGFARWCKKMQLAASPAAPQTVAMYAAHLAQEGRAYETIKRIVAAIRWVHTPLRDEHGEPIQQPTDAPELRAVMHGISRSIGRAPRRQKSAATKEAALEVMVQGLGEVAAAHLRDRVVILVGFSGAFRRSELASLLIEDVRFTPEGAIVRLRRSKTDQEGVGAEVAIPRSTDERLCPVRALQAWVSKLSARGILGGPVVRGVDKFDRISKTGGRTDQTINRIVKRAAVRAGIDPADIGAHSLRAGFATEAALAGKDLIQIAKQGRWANLEVVRKYIRPVEKFRDNAAKGLL
jgi:site-specific recombinase XerD